MEEICEALQGFLCGFPQTPQILVGCFNFNFVRFSARWL